MEIARPFTLLLFLLIPFLYYGHRRSLVDLSLPQRIVSLILRTLIIVLLICSLAGVQYLTTHGKLAVIFLADISDSISEEGLKEAQSYIDETMDNRSGQSRFIEDSRYAEQIGVMAFTEETQVIREFQSKSDEMLDLTEIKGYWLDENEKSGAGTNIAQAIETAWGIFPADANKRIVLISDGVETRGDVLRAGLRGKAFGVQIDTVPIFPSDKPEVMIERIDAPMQVKQGEPFHLEVFVHSNRKDLAEVRLHKNKFEMAKQTVRLEVGENRIRFSQTATESGMMTYDAICAATQDTRYDNNHALGIVVASGKPKVLLIDENESQTRYLARVLEDAEIQVNVRNGLGVPSELSDLQNYDLVIFSDVPANRLNQKQMELIRAYVQDLGGGFMMLGSENRLWTWRVLQNSN